MADVPLHVSGSCIASDEELFRNMDSALLRGLPELSQVEQPHDGLIAIIGSGPSVVDQLDVIRDLRSRGAQIVAVKDAHDWLIDHGIIPDYAFAVDPRRWDCFKKKHKDVKYFIASQCSPKMLDDLQGYNVTLYHGLVKTGVYYPPKKMNIGGATTSGLRAIPVFYVQGWRHFALFGFDSCLKDGILRVDGTSPGEDKEIHEVRFYGKTYRCNVSMALQAQNFQDHYRWMPDARFYAFGEGLIPDIIRQHDRNGAELAAIQKEPDNGRISFIHSWNDKAASYRYRAQIPSSLLSASMNDLSASTLIFAKPQAEEVMEWARAKQRGCHIIVDFCDDHFQWKYYQEALKFADVATCPTEAMAQRIRETAPDKRVEVIPDPYEYPEAKPHGEGVRLLWFGHASNKPSLDRIMPDIQEYPLRIVSNFEGAVPWSYNTMLREFRNCDIVIVPATETYKSANRTVEAIRQGCFVVAEPHPALNNIPGIWIGNIKEGIEWAKRHSIEAKQRTSWGQKYVRDVYAPKTVASAWKSVIQSLITSEAAEHVGSIG